MNKNINGSSVCRFADIEILRYTINDFESLSLDEKLLVYHLSEATLAGRDIIFDQNGAYNLRIRKILEVIYVNYPQKDNSDFVAMSSYLHRLWFSSGIHHHYGSDKFKADFSRTWLSETILKLQKEAFLLEFNDTEISDILDEIFDPSRSPKRTEQSGDEDLLKSSSANFYDRTITQEEAEQYYQAQSSTLTKDEARRPISFGLNNRLIKNSDGILEESYYKIGGLYGEALEQVSTHLKSALAYTQTEAQRQAILDLLDFYKTGNLELYNKFCIEWVQDNQVTIDFINGFTETYTDPLGLKGSWEGMVHIQDKNASKRVQKICNEANWFERNAPIPNEYKKEEAKGISASVVNLAMLGGDSYPATPIGVNLPNADWIRAEYGSKSISIENIHTAYSIASANNGMDEAFIPNKEIRDLLNKYGTITECLHTDLHECLGHGSGKLAEGVSPDSLGAYSSTIEEARADLFALYYMADDKLIELGVLPNNEAYKACYYRYLMNGLITQLVRIPLGQNIEEAHMRNRALIARYVLEQAQKKNPIAVQLDDLELIINDYQTLRECFAELLHEIQRIKSEGDFQSAKTLVEKYAVKIDLEIHQKVLDKYQKLNIAPYKGFVNPKLSLKFDSEGIVDVLADYTEAYDEQMLRYSQDYSFLPLNPVRLQKNRNTYLAMSYATEVKELREGLRRAMDGVVASSMRKKGAKYGINFGLTLEHIQMRAKKLTPSLELANYLLSRDVRELKIIASMVYSPQELTFTEACHIASKIFSNVELRDYFAKFLFEKTPSAPQWAIHWLLDHNKQYEDFYPLASMILVRYFTKNYQCPSSNIEEQLLDKLFFILKGEDVEYITITQNSALLCLKRWIKQPHIAQMTINRPEIKEWQNSQNPIYKEFAEDITFELDYYKNLN